MNDTELEQLLLDVESDRAERKASLSEKEKIRKTICAFANDMPNHQKSGVIFIGVKDDGGCAGLDITDDLLLNLSSMKSDGKIVPSPAMIVEKRVIHGCAMAVVIVEPSYYPPVRCDGRVWIRVGSQPCHRHRGG